MKRLLVVVIVLVAGCGGDDGGSTSTSGGAGLPAAQRYVAMGTTGSFIGPQSTAIAVDGAVVSGESHGRVVIRVSAADAEKLFGLVEGSTEIDTPVNPTTCDDCGTKYAEADGVFFEPSAEFTAEFERLEQAG